MPLENLSPYFLTFLASIARVIPTHLYKFLIFKYSSLFAFYSILAKVIAFQAHVNNSINMAEQLHCSEIYSKNIKNMLSKLYIGRYCIVHDVIKYTQNIASVHST